MYGRKDDFEGYLDETEVGENSSSSNVAQNKDGLCNKAEETEKRHLQINVVKWKGKHIKAFKIGVSPWS